MSVSLSELKQRFSTGREPSAKDFSDLIDALSLLNSGVPDGSLTLDAFSSLAVNSVLQTDGSGNVIAAAFSFPAISGGDGSITGTYPGLGVATGGIHTSHIANGQVTLAKLDTVAAATAGAGSVITYNGSSIVWQTPASIAAQTRTINRVLAYSTTPVVFTITSGTVSTVTVANAQAVIPASYVPALLCVTTDGAYAVGDEVSIEQVTNASFEPAFTFKVNVSNFVLSANCLSTAMQIGSTGITLANWKFVVHAVINVPNAPVTAPTSLQLHNVRTAVSLNGTLYVGHVLPNNQSAVGYATSNSPVKGFGYDSTGYSVRPSYFSAINLNNGNILIGGGVTGGTPFPTSDLVTTYGKGSGCYNTFGMAQLNAVRWPTAARNAIMWIRGNDTNFVTGTAASNADGSSIDPNLGTVSIPKGSGLISTVFLDTMALDTTAGGLTEASVNPPFRNVWGSSGGSSQTFHFYPQHVAIVQVDDSGSHPDFFILGSQFFPAVLPDIKMMMNRCLFGRYSYIGSSYQYVGPAAGGAPTDVPSACINWLNPNIVLDSGQTSRVSDIFASSSATNPIYLLMARYNPVKRRFYVIDALTGMLHIYTLAVTLSSWLGNSTTAGVTGNTLDYTQLTYNGSFVISAGPAHYTNKAYEDIGGQFGSPEMHDMWTVEFDLVTGTEQALCVTRGSQNAIIRIPWIWI